MPALHIIADGDNAWPDLRDRMDTVIHITAPFAITALASGMTSGKTSVALRIDLPDGRTVIAETSLALLGAAVDTFRAKYGQ